MLSRPGLFSRRLVSVIVGPMKTARCPICKADLKKSTDSLPFCSARCKLVDAGNWLDGAYRLEERQNDAPWGEN